MSYKKNKTEKSKCCLTDPSYCSDSGGEKELFLSLSKMKNKIKTFIFIFIMLSAVGVTIFSLSKRGSVIAKECTTNKSNTFNTSQIYKICPLDSLNKLNTIASNKNFVFILYPGNKKAENDKIIKVMEEASKDISKKGAEVGIFTIKKDSTDYKKWIKFYSKDYIPAVVGIYKGCGSDIVKGKITKKKLLESYIRTSKPAGRGSCCPK